MTCSALVGSPSVCGTAQRSSSCASLTRKVTIVCTCMLVCVHVHISYIPESVVALSM